MTEARAAPRWLVDGMNVVGSRPDGWWRDRRGAMRRLVARLEAFAAAEGEPVAVVFDGRPFPIEAGAVEVGFARRAGRDAADDEIARRVGADAHPEGVRVVTSDGELGARARAAGAQVVSAGAFLERLERVAPRQS
jgi:predicted RNA-binding protein with PIN domain